MLTLLELFVVVCISALPTNKPTKSTVSSRPAASKPTASRPAAKADKPEDKWVAAFNKTREADAKKNKDKWQQRSVYSLQQEIVRCRKWLTVSKSKYDKAYWNAAISWLTDLSKEPERIAKIENETEIEKSKDKDTDDRIKIYLANNKRFPGYEESTRVEAARTPPYATALLDGSFAVPTAYNLKTSDPLYSLESTNDLKSRELKRKKYYETPESKRPRSR